MNKNLKILIINLIVLGIMVLIEHLYVLINAAPADWGDLVFAVYALATVVIVTIILNIALTFIYKQKFYMYVLNVVIYLILNICLFKLFARKF